MLNLSFNLTFSDLYSHEGLQRIDSVFGEYLQKQDSHLFALLEAHRCHPEGPVDPDFLINLAPHVEDFVSDLFNIQMEIQDLQKKQSQLSPLFTVKRQFIQRHVLRALTLTDIDAFDSEAARKSLECFLGEAFSCLRYAEAVLSWSQDADAHQEELELAGKYAFWAIQTPEGKKYHHHDSIFQVPQKLDMMNLVAFEHDGNILKGKEENNRCRDGFSLTDEGTSREKAIDQASYCIWCHHQGKDSCSKGLIPKKVEEDRFQRNAFGSLLTGCPLEEKISEMNETRSKGYAVGALAIITIDNPMVAATGHRICNDCVKACIYQKQEPVDIPGIESQTLQDVLDLPWGFEIYSLLTRWNPLNFKRPFPEIASGYSVLVVGMGPAGFTLAHHLMNDGHDVVGIDGLKIEPLPLSLIHEPIQEINCLRVPLDTRINGGFGGVAEYGITSRWDKNNLTIIRLLLERRQAFNLVGGVRFGGTVTPEQAYESGFDHIALCMGAGSPTLIPLKNGLAKGVRQASDFLMALQLTGAAKKESIANLQIELPALVIGGGLTAIDTATEIMAYYPLQVEKFYHRYQILLGESSEKDIQKEFDVRDHSQLEIFLKHGKAVSEERSQAEREKRLPNFLKLVQSWGGVHLVYRREITKSPSYTLNHEEVSKALEEGIWILDQATPQEVIVDDQNHACGLKIEVERNQEIETKIIPAKTILVAAGTKPNVNLAFDVPGLKRSGKTFQAVTDKGEAVAPEKISKPLSPFVFMDITPGRGLSFFGDMHPSFAGNVVKAMGSAKQGYPHVSKLLRSHRPNPKDAHFPISFCDDLRPKVMAVHRLAPKIIELVVHAPWAARNFKPGQFFRLQNFESLAPFQKETRLVMEGIALTGASVDVQKGVLSTIILEMGGSSDLCSHLKPKDPIVLMGPTGEPTEIPQKQNILLVGGGLGNAVLFSIGQALRRNQCHVTYFAGYKELEDRYKVDEIEKAADQIIWCCDETPGFQKSREEDLSYVGNIVDGLVAYAQGTILGMTQKGDLGSIDRLLVIGSDRMMGAVAAARHGVLKPYLNPKHSAYGSINSPMQCMMKEICAQCLQRHVDPLTGEEKIVYSCVNQDQLLDHVDFRSLNDRLTQNRLQEKMTGLWLKKILM